MNENPSPASAMLPVVPWVTHDMVKSSTVELAIEAGRSCMEISQCDYERAKRELTGETDGDRQLAVIFRDWPAGARMSRPAVAERRSC